MKEPTKPALRFLLGPALDLYLLAAGAVPVLC